MASLNSIDVERTGIEANNGLSIVESCQAPIRSTDGKLLMEFSTTDFDVVLAMSVKEINDTVLPYVTVPLLILCGELPRI